VPIKVLSVSASPSSRRAVLTGRGALERRDNMGAPVLMEKDEISRDEEA